MVNRRNNKLRSVKQLKADCRIPGVLTGRNRKLEGVRSARSARSTRSVKQLKADCKISGVLTGRNKKLEGARRQRLQKR